MTVTPADDGMQSSSVAGKLLESTNSSLSLSQDASSIIQPGAS